MNNARQSETTKAFQRCSAQLLPSAFLRRIFTAREN